MCVGVAGAAAAVAVACGLAVGVNSAGTAVSVGFRLGVGVGLAVGMRVATATVADGFGLSVGVRAAEAVMALAVDVGPPVGGGSESHPTSITAMSVNQTVTIDRFRFALIYFLIRYSSGYFVNDV